MLANSTTRATARTWWSLPLLLLPALLVSMDISILFVASPAITAALDPTATQWLWMMDIYGFVMAGLLITMGGLGDRIGRRRLLLIGAALFGAASGAIALASTPEVFIIARAALGVGAATLAPSTLSLLRGLFHDEHQRRKAVGAWTVAFTGGAVAGPIIGGALLEYFWWGAVFLINLPVMLLILAAVPLAIPEVRTLRQARFDLLGAGLSLVAIMSLIFSVKRLVDHRPDVVAAAALVIGSAFLVLFVVRVRRAAHPLIDLTLFRRPALRAAVAANTGIAFAATGTGLLAFTFLQVVHELRPLYAALWALPTFASALLGAVLATTVAARVPAGRLLPAGLLLGALGFGVIGLVRADQTFLVFLGGYVILTFGAGIVGTLANSLVLTTAPPERAGAAAGVSETSHEFGAALGIAVLGTVATAVYQGAIRGAPATVPGQRSVETVAAAAATAEQLDEPARTALLTAAFDAFTTSVNVAAAAGAAGLVLVAVAAAVGLRGTR